MNDIEKDEFKLSKLEMLKLEKLSELSSYANILSKYEKSRIIKNNYLNEMEKRMDEIKYETEKTIIYVNQMKGPLETEMNAYEKEIDKELNERKENIKKNFSELYEYLN